MFNAIILYRISRYLFLKKIPFLPWVIEKIIFIIYNSVIPSSSNIGKGTSLAYGGIGVLIHARAVLGENVKIGSNVTIGGKSGHIDVPVIGDNVYISTGARILGNIKIGNNSIIGANAVVISDVPDYAVVGGIPAQILKFNKNDNDLIS